MIWKVAEFCGVQVVTYAIMPNHFHVLVHVPLKEPIPDEELLRRYKLLHPTPNPYQLARVEVIAGWLKNNSSDGIAWRNQQLALMNNVSAFMRLLKHRFTRWFNATHQRVGTLWAERFKSVLVEYDPDTLRTVAAYIDLNAVRKGLVTDPKDYRFCGYAEALAGSKPARRGLHLVCPYPTWTKAHNHYRTLLYCIGATPRENKAQLDDPSYRAVIAAEGNLSLAEHLRHRWHFFTAGSILGHQAFVAQHQARLARLHSPHTSPLPSTPAPQHPRPPSSVAPGPVPLPPPWNTLATLHRVNRPQA